MFDEPTGEILAGRQAVTTIIQDICDLEPDPMHDCSELNPDEGICINLNDLEMILNRHLRGIE
jgi:hypothetical protein